MEEISFGGEKFIMKGNFLNKPKIYFCGRYFEKIFFWEK